MSPLIFSMFAGLHLLKARVCLVSVFLYSMSEIFNAHVEIKPSALGGRGLFAKKKFSSGDVILVEQPFFTVSSLPWEGIEQANSVDSVSSKKIFDAFQTLDENSKRCFLDFTQAPIYGTDQNIAGIFWTNCIDMEPNNDDSDMCMFPLTCLLNHSCKPTAVWKYMRTSKQIMTCAKCDMIALSRKTSHFSLEPDAYDGKTFQEYLQHWYGFRCNCGFCED
ncbi:hypothetical protein GUITHDRAFT_120234 [Guillardia theta CCMP2712]|uniref:SET domain-containing protein n=1 Tax=Guillardia theta (strain CCMP2712) TaxID=905079 RepID=L1ICE0_GUITC|nr:hypothetical protein GUITHDRAFT_120234 [Guillardia theta CCMP2712]EKX33594.1 hypothetical protein GUITHDRAFT_120234 [Guillardia theta CCMP2712]|eukprot:XP_005820574.1 hypothetical protein GUITHDRAFT_120234 [Guillardia theta CCMP2712]